MGYRTGLFLDPKGRGMTTGYDQAQALAASQTGLDGQAELENEINKVFDVNAGVGHGPGLEDAEEGPVQGHLLRPRREGVDRHIAMMDVGGQRVPPKPKKQNLHS